MKIPVLISMLLIFQTSMADTFLISNGKKYSLQEQSQNKSCGNDVRGPEYAVALYMMKVASGLDKKIDGGLTSKRPTTLFGFIRNYPSRFSSVTCDLLRQECVKECAKFKSVTADECLIECNQYESWNR